MSETTVTPAAFELGMIKDAISKLGENAAESEKILLIIIGEELGELINIDGIPLSKCTNHEAKYCGLPVAYRPMFFPRGHRALGCVVYRDMHQPASLLVNSSFRIIIKPQENAQ